MRRGMTMPGSEEENSDSLDFSWAAFSRSRLCPHRINLISLRSLPRFGTSVEPIMQAIKIWPIDRCEVDEFLSLIAKLMQITWDA
jgi:hypothetical protein